MTSEQPFDDFRALLSRLPPANEAAGDRVRHDFAAWVELDGDLGRLQEIAVWLARWSSKGASVRRPLTAIFAASHGIARHAISRRDVDHVRQQVERYGAGLTATNAICLSYDIGLQVFDLALELPSGDISTEAALDERDCAATMAFGMEAIAAGTDLLCVGNLAAGSSTIASAVFAALFGGEGRDWTSPAADASMSGRRAAIVDQALACHAENLADPLEVLRRLGGRDVAAIAGAILAARMERIPVLLDGTAAMAACAVLHMLNHVAIDHCFLAQTPADAAGSMVAERLALPRVHDLGVRGGGGVAAASAAGIVKAAADTAMTLARSGRAGRKGES